MWCFLSLYKDMHYYGPMYAPFSELHWIVLHQYSISVSLVLGSIYSPLKNICCVLALCEKDDMLLV